MAYLLRLIASVALLFAAFAALPGDALAACINSTATGPGRYCDSRAEAENMAKAACSYSSGNTPGTEYIYASPVTIAGVVYDGRVWPRQIRASDGALLACNSIRSGYENSYYWVSGVLNQCSARAGDSSQWWAIHVSASPSPTQCSDGCEQGFTASGASTAVSPSDPMYGAGYRYRTPGTFTYTGNECSEAPDTDQPDPDQEGTPEGDGWTCNPNAGTCTNPDGEPMLCTFNPDGTRSACVPNPETNEPPPPEDDPNVPEDPRDERTSSGGGGCVEPPQCMGDPIDCGTQWQQWKTRCTIEKGQAAATGAVCVAGAGASTLDCTNLTASQCATQQLMQEAACRLKDIAEATGEAPATGDGSMGDDVPAETAWAGGVVGGSAAGAGDLDDSGFLGGGRTCPVLPVISVMGATMDFNVPGLCDFFGIGSALVLVFAGLASARIIGGAI